MKTNKAVFSSILMMVLLLCSCGGLTRGDFKDSAEGSVSDKILSLASLSPSGHNTQPWTVRIISEDKWIIGWDKNRALGAVDPGNRELIISLGAFCEAVKIASEKYGLHAKITTVAKNNFDDVIAEIVFTQGKVEGKKSILLEKRRIVRKGHLSKPLSAEDKEKLKSDVVSKVYYFDRESEEGKLIEKAVFESNMVQTKREDAVKELADWIRWSDEEIRTKRDGLTPSGMEIGGIANFVVRNFYSREDALTESFRESSMKAVKEQLSSYGTWIIIATEKETPSHLMTAGADFLKIGIAGIEKNIALHPMTQPIEENEFKLHLKKALPVKGEIQFVLRSGYVEEYPLPVSVRMEVKQIIRK
ncbi:MAG TPA: hypothetical protein PK624_07090 [Spirochaetota bacterium]|nr:hypothetical protein [Spirochaetota bacterium]HOR44544.1 hypothetical protein [Spirochaetota bacterium]HOU84318.1 hypothetical protein [Spirochaetota bacterium]HPK56415.1 hypothetical protein [Spirochaetota bacterium]HQE58256.1 hypothetical protein [Spirochaetota bacterium]